MAKEIFKNQTANAVVDTYLGEKIFANGFLQVDVSGVLGGADVITWIKGAAETKTWVRACTWLSTQGDALDEGASAGLQLLNNREVVFEVRNVGVATDINLEFDVE